MKTVVICLLSMTLVCLSLGSDVCSLPPDTGPCDGAFMRYYFDPRSKCCKTFSYGGCEGNKNNFNTLLDCVNHCGSCENDVCSLKPETGPCEALIPRYYFDPDSNCCKKFIYGGCEGNGNNFETQVDCLKHCLLPKYLNRCDGGICSLKPEIGPCDGVFERYYFDPETNCCKTFIYGGCGGNENNFETKEKCLKHCVLPNHQDRCESRDIHEAVITAG